MNEHFALVWRIENFSFCFPRVGDHLKSPTFGCDEWNLMRWSLTLYPRGRRKADRIDLRLVREDDIDRDSLEVDVEFAVLNADGVAAHTPHRTSGVFPPRAETAFSLAREEVQRRSNAFLPGDALTLRVRLWPRDRQGYGGDDRLCVFATTVVRVERWAFPLRVETFSEFGREVDFRTGLHSAAKDCPGFRFRVCPEREGEVAIGIDPYSTDWECLVRCRVSLMSPNNVVVAEAVDEQWFYRYRVKKTWEFPPFISRDKLLKNRMSLLPNDVLTLKVVFNVSLGEWKTSTSVKSKVSRPSNSIAIQTEPIPSGTLQSELKSLYRNKILCDFTLKAGSESFPVHKSLLAARSPVFMAMFQMGMVNDTLSLPDTDAGTLGRLLNFAYGEELEDLDWQNSLQLYSAADKYHIVSLKDVCKRRLKTALDASNAWELLLLADKHQDEDLRKTVQTFIVEKEKSIIAEEEKGPLTLQQVYLKLVPNSQTVSE